MKVKSTKKALLSAVLSLIVCISMLVGSTFAWFTDSVSSMNNIIKSGNLDVELYYMNSETTVWTEVGSATNVFMKDTLWEPGHTEVVKLKVVNAGSLDLKYQLGVNIYSETESVNVNDKPFKLSDYIYFGVVEGDKTYTRTEAVDAVKATAATIANSYTKSSSIEAEGDDQIVTMVVYMPETVGNDANYKKGAAVPTINLGVNLYATQLASEEDSFGSDYDEAAPILPAGVEPEDFAAENAAAVDKAGNFYSTFSAAVASGADTLYLAPGADLGTITHLNVSDDLTIYGNNAAVTGGERDLAVDTYAKLTKDITINLYSVDGIAVWGQRNTAYTVNINAYDCQNMYRIYIGGTSGDNNITLENCSFDGQTSCAVYSNANGTINVVNTTFTNVGEPINLNHKVAGIQTVNVTDCDFINCGNYAVDQNKWAASIRVLSTVAGAESVLNAEDNIFSGAEGIKLNGDIVLNDTITSATVEGTVVATVDDVENAEVIAYPGTTLNGVASTVAPETVPVVSDNTGLKNAISSGEDTVVLAAGNYTVPAGMSTQDITIIGSGDNTVIDMTKAANVNGSAVTFENLKIVGVNANIMNGYGIQGTTGDIVYKNCTFENAYTSEFYGNVSYIGCKFIGTYYIATYAVKSATFENCVFDRTDSRALLVYSHGDNPVQVIVKDCDFKADAKGYTWVPEWTAAVEVDTTNIPSAGTSVTIERCTYDENYNGIVRDKSTAGKETAVITVDGVIVENTTIKTTGYVG